MRELVKENEVDQRASRWMARSRFPSFLQTLSTGATGATGIARTEYEIVPESEPTEKVNPGLGGSVKIN